MINIGANFAKKVERITYTPLQGFRTDREFEGTRDALLAFASSLDRSIYTWTIEESEPPKCKLFVSVPQLDAGNTVAESPTDVYELHGNALQKDIYEHPNSIALTAKVIGAIKAAASKVKSADVDNVATVYAECVSKITAATASAGVDTGNALNLFDLVLKDQISYQLSQYVFRFTRVIGNNSDVVLATSNVDKIYTAEQVLSEAVAPTSLRFSLSTILPNYTVPTGYFWGWLKQTPTQKALPQNKIELTNEWWLEMWPEYLYELKV